MSEIIGTPLISEEYIPLPKKKKEKEKPSFKQYTAEDYLKIISDFFKKKPGSWYITPVETISATPEGEYAKREDIKLSLGYPAESGSLNNYGEGNLYVKIISIIDAKESANEIKIPPGHALRWYKEEGYGIIAFHIRTDKDNTSYQLICG